MGKVRYIGGEVKRMSDSVIIIVWLTTVAGSWLFQHWLRSAKVVQRIYELSPETHQKKSFTPSMGGCVFIPIIAVGCLLTQEHSVTNLWLIGVMIVFGLIGLLDDISSIKNKVNKGLSAKRKFWIQNGIALIALYVFHIQIGTLELWEWPLYIFLLTGTSNATNLTDGLDGLLAGLAIITFWGFFSLGSIEVMGISFIVVVALSGFLMLNSHPAKLFMGDTGSLALGGLMAGMAIVMREPFILIPFGAVYIIETVSVIIQVAYFKRTKKRIFLMSPLHHHFELLGIKEVSVVRIFWLMGLVFIMVYAGLTG